MERSERDQLEQLIKSVLIYEIDELLAQALDDGSYNEAYNKAMKKIDDCAEAIVRQWEKEKKGD